MLSTILLFAISAVVLRVIYEAIYNIFLHPLRDIPGPIHWRAYELFYTRSALRGTLHKDVLRLHQQYGDIVRISPTQISHTKGEIWRDVWGHNKSPEFSKAISAVPTNGAHGILTADREDHRRFRHLLSNSFSAQAMAIQERRIQHYIDLLMRQLTAHGTSSPQDMVTWFNWTTFDVIGDLSFGESFSCLETTTTHPWVRTLLNLLRYGQVATAADSYGLTPILQLIMPKSINATRLKTYAHYHDKVARRIAYGKDRGDFLDTILQHPLLSESDAAATPPHEKTGMTLRELESNASNLVLAGSETTATLLSGALFHLLANPRVLHKLQSQVRSTFASEADITMVAASTKLPYLLNVLDETLRVYNPVPMVTGRKVPPTPQGGVHVAGRWYPSGTRVYAFAYCMNAIESNFARPNEFVPERWLPRRPSFPSLSDSSAEKPAAAVDEEEPDEDEYIPAEFNNDNLTQVFQPFSAGPRNCIGRNLAYAEMRVILAKLLWGFELSVPEEDGRAEGWEQWASRQKCYILWEKGPLWVDVRRREGV